MNQRSNRFHQRGGGVLDMDAYAKLSEPSKAHMPRTLDETRSAVKELAARGLGDYDIASATGLSVEGVRRLLGEHSENEAMEGPSDRGAEAAVSGHTRTTTTTREPHDG